MSLTLSFVQSSQKPRRVINSRIIVNHVISFVRCNDIHKITGRNSKPTIWKVFQVSCHKISTFILMSPSHIIKDNIIAIREFYTRWWNRLIYRKFYSISDNIIYCFLHK